MEDYVECAVKDSAHVATDIEGAIAELEKKSVAGVTKGLEDMADALNTIAAGVQQCTQSKDITQLKKIMELVKSFKNPKTFAMHVSQDILVNGADIFKQIEGTVSNFKAAKYEPAGENIGDALAEILIGTLAQEKLAAKKAVNPTDVEQIIIGVLEGAVDAEGLENIEGCVKDTETLYSEVEAAVKDFEKHTAEGTIEGLKMLGQAVVEIKEDIKECEGVVADWEKLEKMAEIFSNPITFAYHVGHDIIVNGAQIYHEVDDSVAQFESANYRKFGDDVGEADRKSVV